MNNAFKSSSHQQDMSIDWEFQPSLNHLVVRTATRSAGPVWAETLPVAFDALSEPDPFHEPLEGLAIREMNEPDIFTALFGDAMRAGVRK